MNRQLDRQLTSFLESASLNRMGGICHSKNYMKMYGIFLTNICHNIIAFTNLNQINPERK